MGPVATKFLKEALQKVKNRGTCYNNSVVLCSRCNSKIEYVATTRRLFGRETKPEGVFVTDRQIFVEVVHVFCPKCDGRPDQPLPGSIVYNDEISSSNIWR